MIEKQIKRIKMMKNGEVKDNLKEFVGRLSEVLNQEPIVRYSHNLQGSKVVNGKFIRYSDCCLTRSFVTLKYRLVFKSFDEGNVELWMIEVNENQRGKEIGTDLMNKILDVSDELGIGVKLIPYPFRTNLEKCKTTKDKNSLMLGQMFKLKEWYRSFGFVGKNPHLSPYLSYTPEVFLSKKVA